MTESEYSSIRTGVIGLGNIGQYHAERLRDLGVQLGGGLDVSKTARDRFQTRYDVPVYEAGAPLYEDCDAVIITTPNTFHEPYVIEALEAGCHVLVEKPLAHSLESAERIAEAADSSDRVCMVGFNNRFLNTVQIVRNRIESGFFGDITHIEANYVRRRGVPGRGSWFTRRSVAGGGSLIDLGVHAIDLALYIFDFPQVTEVNGVTRSEFGSRDDYAFLEMWGDDGGSDEFDVDDSASAFIRCADSRTVSLEVAWATNRPANHDFIIRGTEAAARFDIMEGDLTLYSVKANGPNHFEDTTVQTTHNDTHADEQRAFFQAVIDGRGFEESVEQGVTVQRVIDAIYRSSESGGCVTSLE
ncbi:Gfo/Idh/MocA family protein [Natrialbaceae archaeon A-chndr2]|uniref:Gfo/Idh/MocA family protein n=1 Tax=Natronosalvus amylolyticus TaxID=2961994 RepID=UPI0020C9FF3C|nr:Gfo/Idh/MocA family oxidoreductase [Natronosalvus amylolyticus]